MTEENLPAVDIVIIGSGMAGSSTLIALFELLLADDKKQYNPLTITVIEHYHELWKGVPYGKRSSINALTITTINDFFTDDKERAAFFAWFLPRKGDLLNIYASSGGTVAETWLKDNHKVLAENDWNNIYLPRFIIGEYTAQKLELLKSEVARKNLAHVETINADAIAVKQTGKIKSVVVDHSGHKIELPAKKIVVAIGSAPVRKLTNVFDHQNQVLYINNLHDKDLEETVNEIRSHLKPLGINQNNILIIGSNASSIELLYLLQNTTALRDNIDSIDILSNGGKLPGHITYDRYNHLITDHLDALATNSEYDIEQLITAATQDITGVVEQKVSVPDVDRIMGLTIKMLAPLDDESKKLFYAIYGVELARLFRRSGTDYKNAADNLIESGKLNLIKGSYRALTYNNNGNVTLSYTQDNGVLQLTKNYSVVINCTGSEDLEKSSSTLIQDLIKNNGFKVNPSHKAFLVNDNLEAAPDMYVAGPLVGGNFNKTLYFWHLENASRIMYLSKHLASVLLR